MFEINANFISEEIKYNLTMLTQRLLAQSALRSCIRSVALRTFATNPGTSTYDGDGKTSVSIMNNEVEGSLMVNAFSQMGFRLNNGMMVLGPMALFPK